MTKEFNPSASYLELVEKTKRKQNEILFNVERALSNSKYCKDESTKIIYYENVLKRILNIIK